MGELPRIGLAVSGVSPEPSMAGLAMLAGLSSRGTRVQHFRSKACPLGIGGIREATGLPGRHLDAWLMPTDVCRSVFVRGASLADLAVVEGTLGDPVRSTFGCDFNRPGRLAPIARALDLPVVAVIACPGRDDFHLPDIPTGVDAILLDELDDPADYPRLKYLVSLLARRPVIGAVERIPATRDLLADSGLVGAIPQEQVDRLAASFLRFADLDALRDLASSRPMPSTDRPACPPPGRPRIRVAYALDRAFGNYFPDTLETLESLGADLLDFSPLRDESLPPDVDLVLIGCGFPDVYAETLAANQCLISSLKAHVCQGRRIYSEGGGTAYLGRSMILPDRCINGAGILPIDSTLRLDVTAPVPVERILDRDGWLGPKGTTVRGYRSGRWNLSPAEIDSHCHDCHGMFSREGDFAFHHHAVGSLIHLHLGALPEVVSAFLGPHRPSLNLPRVHRDR